MIYRKEIHVSLKCQIYLKVLFNLQKAENTMHYMVWF